MEVKTGDEAADEDNEDDAGKEEEEEAVDDNDDDDEEEKDQLRTENGTKRQLDSEWAPSSKDSSSSSELENPTS